MIGDEAWLYKANNDLKSALKLLESNDPIMDTAIYHTQQCAEKALKDYLAFKREPLKKTHDIELLVEICSAIDDEFEKIYDYLDVQKSLFYCSSLVLTVFQLENTILFTL